MGAPLPQEGAEVPNLMSQEPFLSGGALHRSLPQEGERVGVDPVGV